MTERKYADDEMLSALLDGALSPEDAARLEQRLDREPILRARLDALERANTTVRDAYASVVHEPLPKELLDLLGAERAVAENVVPIGVREPKERAPLAPLALAASLALAFGLALGILVAPNPPAGDPLALAAAAGLVAPGTPLFEVLERAPSAESRELSAGVTATPVLTFGNASGGYCREVDVVVNGGATQMLACRRDAAWRLVHTSYVGGVATDGVYRPASGPSPALDTAIDELIDGAPLDAAAERALIESGWNGSR